MCKIYDRMKSYNINQEKKMKKYVYNVEFCTFSGQVTRNYWHRICHLRQSTTLFKTNHLALSFNNIIHAIISIGFALLLTTL